MKQAAKLTREEMEELGSLIVKGDINKIMEMRQDPKASVMQVMLSSVALKIINKGDMHALDLLLNRLVGKVSDKVHHTGDIGPQVIVQLPSKEK